MPGLEDLPEREREIIRRCLIEALNGPLFPDWEFQTLFGLEREDLQEVVDRWPDLDSSQPMDHLAINNSLNNLLGYPHGQWDSLMMRIKATREEVVQAFSRWRESLPASFQGDTE